MKIGSKITSYFIIAVALLTGFAMLSFYIPAKNNLRKEIFAHLNAVAQSRARHVETFLETEREKVVQLSESMCIANLLLADKGSPGYGGKLEVVTERLDGTEKASKCVQEFFVMDTDGRIVNSSDRKSIGLDRSTNAYFLGGRRWPYIKDAYRSGTTGEKCLVISAPVIEKKKFVGVVAARFALDKLDKIATDRTGLGETGDIYLVNKYGYMVTPSRFVKDTFLRQKVDTVSVRAYFEDVEEFGSRLHLHEPMIYTDYRGVRVLGRYDHIPCMQWCLVAEIDEKEALAPLAGIRNTFIGIMFAILLVSWLIAIYVSRSVSAPIRKLHKGTEEIGRGDLGYRVGTDAKDEIGQLSRAFDMMTGNLSKSLDELIVAKDYTDKIVRSMIDTLIVVDPERKIKTINKATSELLGYKEKELIGKPVATIFEEEERVSKGIAKVLKEGVVTNYDMVFLAKSGERIPVGFNAVTMKGENGEITAMVGVARDMREINRLMQREKELVVTAVAMKAERKRADELQKAQLAGLNIMEDLDRKSKKLEKTYHELKEIQNKLIRSEKLASIGQLAGGVAHELNNPLTSIMLNVQRLSILLKKQVADMPDLRIYAKGLERVERATERCKGIVDSLLTSYHTPRFELTSTDVNEVIKETLKYLHDQIKTTNVEVSKGFAAHLPKVETDRQQLRMAFSNLIVNSCDAMVEGGRLRIKTRLRNEAAEESSGTKAEAGTAVEIEFSDTGDGISEKDMIRIFDPFFTTKAPGKGVGLGLSITYGIIEKLGGTLEVTSEEGTGTTFTVLLPVKAQNTDQ